MNDLEQIALEIASKNNIDFIDAVFVLFSNNKIDVNELSNLLAAKGIKLPNEFYILPKKDQKCYRRWYKTTVFYEDGKWTEVTNFVFSNAYYYNLVEKARKTKCHTKRLIEYAWNLCEVNIAFLTMQYVKVKNTFLYTSKDIRYKNSIDGAPYDDLYSLVFDVFKRKPVSTFENEFRNAIIDLFARDDFFGIDFNNALIHFYLMVEAVFANSKLTKREINTLKIKYLILKKDNLRKIDYIESSKAERLVLKNYKNKLSPLSVSQLINYVKQNPNVLDGVSPNGYVAFYNALIQE